MAYALLHNAGGPEALRPGRTRPSLITSLTVRSCSILKIVCSWLTQPLPTSLVLFTAAVANADGVMGPVAVAAATAVRDQVSVPFRPQQLATAGPTMCAGDTL